jgi:hypothetical protein
VCSVSLFGFWVCLAQVDALKALPGLSHSPKTLVALLLLLLLLGRWCFAS